MHQKMTKEHLTFGKYAYLITHRNVKTTFFRESSAFTILGRNTVLHDDVLASCDHDCQADG